ncbi:RNA-binding S4 domain-containing protein [Desulfofalx alkaliphila]|uniref:RNA-binding S4 domain-containing protein n=1 Tax=Desulfofalx alkaliphila TaxID=105483 RepID=UPI0004E19D33|nr:RNA-binding S4 domain-containing protein [Desulfofalx alkaliphila]
MRLDKFLKVSRIIKRRTLAKEVCDSGKIDLNGRVAKAASEVKPGDILNLDLGRRKLKVKIVEVKDTVPAKEAASLYEVLEETGLPQEQL